VRDSRTGPVRAIPVKDRQTGSEQHQRPFKAAIDLLAGSVRVRRNVDVRFVAECARHHPDLTDPVRLKYLVQPRKTA